LSAPPGMPVGPSHPLTFVGRRKTTVKCFVHIVDATGEEWPLPRRLDIANHSPTGFEWGYGGSGPAQLALAILVAVLGDDRMALRLHQNFKWDVIARLERDQDWTITEQDVRDWRDMQLLMSEDE
jgi:Family of unknown function (DUF6166)